MIRIKNTAEDYSKATLHRTAPRFELEPSLGGQRIRLKSFIDITDEHYARVKPQVDVWVAAGMVEVEGGDNEKMVRRDANGFRLDGPTLEQYMAAGYSAATYPPSGYAPKPSKALNIWRQQVEDKNSKEAAELKAAEEEKAAYLLRMKQVADNFGAVTAAGAAVIKEALELPSVTEQVLPPTPIDVSGPVELTDAGATADVILTAKESAGAPVTPAPDDKSSAPSKPGKKKLF